MICQGISPEMATTSVSRRLSRAQLRAPRMSSGGSAGLVISSLGHSPPEQSQRSGPSHPHQDPQHRRTTMARSARLSRGPTQRTFQIACPCLSMLASLSPIAVCLSVVPWSGPALKQKGPLFRLSAPSAHQALNSTLVWAFVSIPSNTGWRPGPASGFPQRWPPCRPHGGFREPTHGPH